MNPSPEERAKALVDNSRHEWVYGKSGLTFDDELAAKDIAAAIREAEAAGCTGALETVLQNAVDKLANWDDDRDRDGVAYQSQGLADLVCELRAALQKGGE